MTLYTGLRKKDKIMTANDSRSFHLLPYWYGNLCERSAYRDTGPFRFVDFWVIFFCRVTLLVNDGCPVIM